jgi:malonyl CoA-acyl carrier protein transacylase
MGEELFQRYPRECAAAEERLGYSLVELCRRGGGQLNQTAFTQPAVYLVSCLAYQALLEDGQEVRSGAVIGHSAGLYAALFAAGVVELIDGLEIIAKRGKLMQSASGGAMLATIGPAEAIDRELARLELFDIEIANYNGPEQTVLSGAADRLAEAGESLTEAGYRCIPLPVSGAFHSRHMEASRREFVKFLVPREFAAPNRPVVSTTTGQQIGMDRILEELTSQLVRPVRWWQTVDYLAQAGATEFREIGPGHVLTDLTKKIIGASSREATAPQADRSG